MGFEHTFVSRRADGVGEASLSHDPWMNSYEQPSDISRYVPRATRSNRGDFLLISAARQFLTDDHDTGSPSNLSTATWIFRTCIGVPAASKTAARTRPHR
jgi:hypothetical protein